MKTRIGIILKKYMPKKNKIVVFDQIYGKIIAVSYDEKLLTHCACGTVIQYVAYEMNQIFLCRQIELLSMPIQLNYEDIFFLHHLLELCYYFLPIGHAMEELFSLLIFVLSFPHRITTRIHKKMIIWRILVQHGLYPELDINSYKVFKNLMQITISTMLEKTISHTFENVLDEWVFESIHSHPSVQQFKTISYVGKSCST